MKEYKVQSSTSNKVYTVRYFEETDKWACECPSYVFHAEGFECKHIKQVKQGVKK
jgi:cupin superfamily acireductone dioxygenase involved in methionine salvage